MEAKTRDKNVGFCPGRWAIEYEDAMVGRNKWQRDKTGAVREFPSAEFAASFARRRSFALYERAWLHELDSGAKHRIDFDLIGRLGAKAWAEQFERGL